MSNTLLILTGHQDSDDKVKHVINSISKLKSDGVDICYTTHVSKGLSEISNLCDWVIYDSDNSFSSEKILFENLSSVSIEVLNNYLLYNYPINNELHLVSSFHLNHSKAQLLNIKNGINLAKQKGYKWVCILEYDCAVPELNVKEYLERKVLNLERMNKTAYLYHTEDMRGKYMIYPYMLLINIGFIEKTSFFNTNWETSEVDWVKISGNKCLEQILYDIFKPFPEECLIRSAWEINTDFGFDYDNFSHINKFDFSQSDSWDDENYWHKYFEFNLFCHSSEDVYELSLWIVPRQYLIENNIIYKISNIEVILENIDGVNQILSLPEEIEVSISWFCWPTISNYRPQDNDKIHLKYTIITPSGKKIENKHFVPLSQLDKYEMIKKVIKYE